MRALFAALLLAACATAPPLTPPERVAGCWIARGTSSTTTMRWLPDRERPGRLVGEWMNMAGTTISHRTYRLEPAPSADGVSQAWTLCQAAAAEGQDSCWQVAQGESGPLENGRVFIDQHREHLRIALFSVEGERLLFEGERDGCD